MELTSLRTLRGTQSASALRQQQWRTIRPAAMILALIGLIFSVGSAPAHASPTCDVVGSVVGAGPVGGFLCDKVGDAAAGTAADWVTSTLGKFVQSMLDGMGKALEWALSWWIKLPSPDLENFTALQVVRDYTFEIQLYLLTASLVMVGIRVLMASRSTQMQESQETFKMFTHVVFSSFTFAAVITTASKVSDEIATWILAGATNNDPGAVMKNIVDTGALTSGTFGMGPLLLLGIIGLIGAFAQVVMLVIRQVFLIIVVAVIPLAGAASGTGAGSQSYKKLQAWCIGFVLFKPIGALVYLIAFASAGSGSKDEQQVWLGLIMLCLAALVLPALMKVITPAIGTMGSGGSGLGAATLAAGATAGIAKLAAGGFGGAAAGGGGSSVAARSGGGGGPAMAGVGGSAGGGGGTRSGGGAAPRTANSGGSSSSGSRPASTPSRQSGGPGGGSVSTAARAGDAAAGVAAGGASFAGAVANESAGPPRGGHEMPQ